MSTTLICSAEHFCVVAQAGEAKARSDASDVLKTLAINNFGEYRAAWVPSQPSAQVTGPYRVPRYNLYPAAELDGAAAPGGYSQGQAIQDHGASLRTGFCHKAFPTNGPHLPSSKSAPAILQPLHLCWP